MSDHFPVVYFHQNPKRKTCPKFIETRNYSQTNLSLFSNSLCALNWDSLLECNDAQLAYNIFFDTFMNLYEFHFPIYTVKLNKNLYVLKNG